MAEGVDKSKVKEEYTVSEEEYRLLRAFQALGVQPDPVDISRVNRALRTEPGVSQPRDEHQRGSSYHFPKISSFYGEDGKGDVTWETFKYEVQGLLHQSGFTNDQILLGLRRSLKGEASDRVRRLGSEATVDEIMAQLENDYGTLESPESMMQKLYTCKQAADESVQKFATRLEDCFDKVVSLGGMKRDEKGKLKDLLHNGLRQNLKHLTLYQRDKCTTYEEFKKEVRRVESQMKDEVASPKHGTCKAAVPAKKTEVEELQEVKQMLIDLTKRMDKAEQSKDQAQQKTDDYGGYRQYKSNRGGYRDTSQRGGFRGRGSYQPKRPLAGRTFMPTCYLCNEKGHVQWNCPKILGQMTCSKCKQKGHITRDCPN